MDPREQRDDHRDQRICADPGAVAGPGGQTRAAGRGVAGEQGQDRDPQRDDRHRDCTDHDRHAVPEQPDRRADTDGPQPADAVVRRVRGRRDVGRDRREHDHQERQQCGLQGRQDAGDPARCPVEGTGEELVRAGRPSRAGPRPGAVQDGAGEAHAAMVAAVRVGRPNPVRRVARETPPARPGTREAPVPRRNRRPSCGSVWRSQVRPGARGRARRSRTASCRP